MFPNNEAFDKEMEKIAAKTIPWKDLKVDKIYRINEKREVPLRSLDARLYLPSPTSIETAS